MSNFSIITVAKERTRVTIVAENVFPPAHLSRVPRTPALYRCSGPIHGESLPPPYESKISSWISDSNSTLLRNISQYPLVVGVIVEAICMRGKRAGAWSCINPNLSTPGDNSSAGLSAPFHVGSYFCLSPEGFCCSRPFGLWPRGESAGPATTRTRKDQE